MLVLVKVSCIGLGHNRAQYPADFEFTMNAPSDWQTNNDFDQEVQRRAVLESKKKTACSSVHICGIITSKQ